MRPTHFVWKTALEATWEEVLNFEEEVSELDPENHKSAEHVSPHR